MPIISKETFDKFTQEEKEKVREIYKSTKDEEHRSSRERNAVLSLMVDRYESLFGKENLQPQPLTYEDVARELFEDKDVYWFRGLDGLICKTFFKANGVNFDAPNNSTSRKQAEKLLAINKLLNVAKFLNGKDWKPDEIDGKLWTIGIEKYNKTIMPVQVGAYDFRTEIVYFRTEELAEKAIQILGEDTVRLALTTEY